jgi:hypothetical protein
MPYVIALHHIAPTLTRSGLKRRSPKGSITFSVSASQIMKFYKSSYAAY